MRSYSILFFEAFEAMLSVNFTQIEGCFVRPPGRTHQPDALRDGRFSAWLTSDRPPGPSPNAEFRRFGIRYRSSLIHEDPTVGLKERRQVNRRLAVERRAILGWLQWS